MTNTTNTTNTTRQRREDGPMRTPPQSMRLEKALLCTVLTDPRALDACDVLKAEDFYSEANAEIWRSFHRVRARGLTPDGMTVREDLERVGKLAAIGGDEYLFAITENLVPTHEPEKHAQEIKLLAQRRHAILTLTQLTSRGYDNAISTKDWLEEVERAAFDVTRVDREGEGLQRMDPHALFDRLQETQRRRAANESALVGLSTGLKSLDERLLGLQPGKLYIVAGRPGMGKSTLARGLSRAVARAGRLVCVFSAEMSAEEHDEAYAAMISPVSGRSLLTGQLSQRDYENLCRGLQEMKDSPLLRDDQPRVALPRIRSRIRRAVARSEHELGLVVIDHIGLVKSGLRIGERRDEIGEIAMSLKELAKELRVPVVALSQINRACEGRPDKRPQLSDLRESGELEQSADAVIFVYRQGYYAARLASGQIKNDPRNPTSIQPGVDDGVAELIVAKHRGGATGTEIVRFDGWCTRFVDTDHHDSLPAMLDTDDGLSDE